MRNEIRRKLEENRLKNANKKRMVKKANPYEVLQAKFKAVADLKLAEKQVEEKLDRSLAQRERRKREKQARELLNAVIRLKKGEIHVPEHLKDPEPDLLDNMPKIKLPYR